MCLGLETFCVVLAFQSSFTRNLRLSESLRKNQLWNGLVTITLLEGKNMPRGGLAEIFILLKLGDQRYKSKVSIKDFLKLKLIGGLVLLLLLVLLPQMELFLMPSSISEFKIRRPDQKH